MAREKIMAVNMWQKTIDDCKVKGITVQKRNRKCVKTLRKTIDVNEDVLEMDDKKGSKVVRRRNIDALEFCDAEIRRKQAERALLLLKVGCDFDDPEMVEIETEIANDRANLFSCGFYEGMRPARKLVEYF